MKELVAFRKHLNEGPEPQSEYKVTIYEADTRVSYNEIVINEDLINELRDEVDFEDTWEEVQEEIKNDKFDGSSIWQYLIDAGYDDLKDGNESLEYSVDID